MTKMMMMMMMISMLMLIMQHPLALTLALVTQSSIVAITSGLLHLNFWYSYIMFMIMVGGMLVIFIYMTSVASNEKIKMEMKFISTVTLMLPLFTLSNDQLLMNFMSTQASTSMNLYTELSMIKFINPPMNTITTILIVYLLITLIAIVKITEIKHGPLRHK